MSGNPAACYCRRMCVRSQRPNGVKLGLGTAFHLCTSAAHREQWSANCWQSTVEWTTTAVTDQRVAESMCVLFTFPSVHHTLLQYLFPHKSVRGHRQKCQMSKQRSSSVLHPPSTGPYTEAADAWWLAAKVFAQTDSTAVIDSLSSSHCVQKRNYEAFVLKR